eukprot:961873-Amphidinium_carterae.1
MAAPGTPAMAERLVDKDWAASVTKAPMQAKVHATAETQARRAIKDNFPTWTEKQVEKSLHQNHRSPTPQKLL